MRTSHSIITTPERWDRLPDRLRHDPGADVRAWIEATPDPVERSNQVRDLGVDQIRSVCANGSPADLSALLGEVDPDAAARFLAAGSDGVLEVVTVARALERLPAGGSSQILRHLPEGRREPLLAAMGRSHRDALTSLLRWPADSAAASMTPSILTRPHATTAEAAGSILRRNASQAEAAKYIYLLGDGRAVVGVVSFRNLVVTAPCSAW